MVYITQDKATIRSIYIPFIQPQFTSNTSLPFANTSLYFTNTSLPFTNTSLHYTSLHVISMMPLSLHLIYHFHSSPINTNKNGYRVIPCLYNSLGKGSGCSVELLCYKAEVRGFDPRRGHWIFQLT
jgi:hypothetical protein